MTLSTASGVAASVDYVTDQDVPAFDPLAFVLAEAGSDFTHQEGTLTFAPGETSKTIRARVLEDTVVEPVEAVVVTLDNPVNPRFEFRDVSDTRPWSGCYETECCNCGTILNDDAAGLSIGDAEGAEGESAALRPECTWAPTSFARGSLARERALDRKVACPRRLRPGSRNRPAMAIRRALIRALSESNRRVQSDSFLPSSQARACW